ncbi:hypothetical protein MXL46_01870 [Heyndrickxia sporothermodurans]|uniref:DUF4025 domain-containing protein n=1 Tax=Heyndrickxia sporothermodurans TaxID=46224 RepID=A0A150LFH2_9BACI|nr:hypothetical protein [Heyndrickxia sporothermodurans]KYD10779.1 hypothetical protein B4102_1564 [Heyndrickxia sporothermodurans]MBL5766325.1 hypothetical protein [Heyndrickxia sporothermodurans]MBL5769764.1 hypothetical protein [Heyndrickxia sporothermodurans]MBL5773465.1 hypothetical protein [Heyndrickxia sporothermodurans]MBL5777622.1 hypothetical protein [Heyndrickxia sporothermodurans]
MKKQDREKEIIYNEQGINQTTNQIMGAYASGVVDQPDGQFHIYDQDEEA